LLLPHRLMKNPIDNFDYRIECDDFFLYELGRLIDEDRVSLEDEEFRQLIEAGIHEHIERRLEIRAEIAGRLRKLTPMPTRLVHAIEDIESPLRDAPLIVQSYTAYLFRRLEACSDEKPDDRVEAAADLLLESPEDRAAAEMSLTTLGSTRSAAGARVLAYVISEPMLEEDLETKAYSCARAMWPLARPYILYSLKPHTHEDIPFRWFQLFVDCDEPSTIDRILEEVLVHAQNSNYREDLLALLELLAQSRDPAAEEKILQVVNSDETSHEAREILEGFLRDCKLPKQQHADIPEPWKSLARLYVANEKYLAAAKLFDSGRKVEAARKLEEVLREEPQYPLGLMLKRFLG
jgi:hypothetical protein